MGDELTIYAKILATLSGQGFTQAEAGLGKTEKAAKRAAGELLGAEAAGKQLGRTLQQYLGAAVLGNLVKTSVVEFARYERSLAAIGKQIDTLGGNAGDSLPQVRAFLETLERTSGTARQDLIPTFQKFLGITGSVQGAMYSVALASDLVEANLGDMGTVSASLAGILAGRVGPAALALGLNQRKANGEIKTASELIQELDANYSGFGKTQTDTADKLDRLSASWNSFKQDLGAGAAILSGAVGPAFDALVRSAKSMFLVLSTGAIQIVKSFATVGNTLLAVFDVEKLLKSGPGAYAEAVKTAALAGAREVVAIGAGTIDELEAIWTKAGEASGEAMAKGQADADAVARRKQAELEADERRKAAKKAAEEAAKAAADEAKAKREQLLDTAQFQQDLAEKFQAMALEEADQAAQDAEEQRVNERNAMIGLLDEQIAALEENDARRLELQALRLELEMAAELEATNLTEEAKAKIRAKYRKQEERLIKAAAKAEVDVDKQAKLLKYEIAQLYAEATFAVMGEIFGANKALAIAEALIFTFLGAAKALAENPPPSPIGIASAAFVIATGLARVNQIRKTDFSKNKGFDVPAHDRLAYMGGRRWAEDMVRNVDLGFRDGFAALAQRSDPSVLSGGSQTSNTYHQTLNFGHVLGGRAEARRIARILDRARERDEGRRVR